jgi:hypothetical protein
MQFKIQSFNKFSFFDLKKLAYFDLVFAVCKQVFKEKKERANTAPMCLRAETTVYLATQFFSSNHNMQFKIQSFNKFSFLNLKNWPILSFSDMQVFKEKKEWARADRIVFTNFLQK